MTRKVDLYKRAWQWVEKLSDPTTEEVDLNAAYRLDLKHCTAKSCRRNCKSNPNCLSAIGERNWFGDIDDSKWTDLDDPNLERRSEDTFVGLANLGATCYVNSLLQLWFQNVVFRKGIFLYRPDREERSPSNVDDAGRGDANNIVEYFPESAIGQLQVIFALLQFSGRRFVDPTRFVKSLGLNTDEQQDAQEFSKLFMSLLEIKLKNQSDPRVSQLVQEQFVGEYSYVTTCSRCFNESKRPSKFYELELNIKGHEDLHQCIKEFTEEEKMEGDNQYYCSNCKSKQNASRKIQMTQLPPVLNLQLLRFVFDRESGQKKKLHSSLKFPEMLDMNVYLDRPDFSAVYQLNAVLIHRGSSAYSGHYVALIRDAVTGSWFKFDDESVDKIDEKDLKSGLEDEDDSDAPKQKKSGRLPKGTHSSPNAYMLVYHQRDDQAVPRTKAAESADDWGISTELKNVVDKDEIEFEQWVADMSRIREGFIQTGRERQSDIQEIYPELFVQENELWEWLDTDWLLKWLSDDGKPVPPITNNITLCPHNKIHPDDVVNMKRVSKRAAYKLFRKYKGSPRLGMDMLCRECVVRRAQLLLLQNRLKEDYKYITSAMRQKISDDSLSYWVGKSSLRCWRKIALEPFRDNQNPEPIETSDDANDDGLAMSSENNNHIEEDHMSVSNFNDDVICQHGNLDPNENRRRLVSNDTWHRLKYHFPKVPEFTNASRVCGECLEAENELNVMKDVHKTLAQEQKAHLEDLYFDRSRPQLTSMKPDKCFVISRDFLCAWRKFIKEPSRSKPITDIHNSVLLCQHEMLPFVVSTCMDKLKDRLALVWKSEWDNLSKFFKVDHTICLTVEATPGGEDVPLTVISEPDVCLPCRDRSVQELEQRLLTYRSANVYVCRLPSETVVNDATVNSKDNDDLDIEQASKKRKVNNSGTPSRRGRPPKSISSPTPVQDASFVRRSTRHRRGRNERTFSIASTTTLKELKLKIMKSFSVPPFDQHVILDSVELTGSDATMGELGVAPDTVLFLSVDEPKGEDSITDESASIPEEGFKGTQLLNN